MFVHKQSLEERQNSPTLQVLCPENASPGSYVRVPVQDGMLRVKVPPGIKPGMTWSIIQ